MEKSVCANKLKFQYAVAEQSSSSAPTSNIPIKCPECKDPKAPAIWRYLLPYHLKETHKLNNLEPHSSLWEITDSERSQLKTVWKERHTVKCSRKTKRGPSFQISEAHSTRLALR